MLRVTLKTPFAVARIRNSARSVLWLLLLVLLANAHAETQDPESDQVPRDPSNQNLVLMPTAFTPPQGTVFLRHLEVLFLNLNYSTSDWTSLGIGAMLPVTDEFNLLTFAAKQQILKSNDQTFCIALAGNLFLPIRSNVNDGRMLWTGNLILSSQPIPLAGLHGMVGMMDVGEKRIAQSVTFGVGSNIRLTSHAILLAEYLGAPALRNQSVNNLVNAGIRLHGKYFAADLCAMMPVGTVSEFPVFPLLNFAYRF